MINPLFISYNKVLSEVERQRSIAYDESNEEHEQLLYRLWSLLKGDDDPVTERHSARWTEIGFQGHNPATDFRVMGILR